MTLGGHILYLVLCVFVCLSPSLSRGGAVLLCVSQKVSVQVEAADWLKSWRLLTGGIIRLGHLKVEPAADLASRFWGLEGAGRRHGR